ncbi:hypothetical protein EJ110_NYTH19333 [Nymphaea thermarum]|nr:hypothetical protein EJ110_NYTH19333 [Nymphaea thermarum]
MNLNVLDRKNEYMLRFLHHQTVASAHNSAAQKSPPPYTSSPVKCKPSNVISFKFPVGVWVDGTWVFSTGLDQRVRSWHLGGCGKMIECACLIVDVPEPEGLDAKACGRNSYQIVVGGRGMQMVEFVVPYDTDLVS